MSAVFARIKAFFQRIPVLWSTYLQRIETEGRIRFLTFAWGTTLSFLGFLLLAAFNPVYLLLPGALYPPPRVDVRVALPVSTFTQGGEPVFVDRYIHPDYGLEDRLMLMAHFISQLPTPAEYPENMPDLMPMPHFGLAVRKIWRTEQGIVVDLRGQTLDAEMDLFLKSHATRERAKVAQAWFSAFTSGALGLESVQFVEYVVDGQKKAADFPGFDLARRYTRP